MQDLYLSAPGSGLLKYCRSVQSNWLDIGIIPSTHQEYKGRLSFAADAWTSPNHRAFIAISVHFQVNGTPLSTLLDIVEIPQSHTGVFLAQGFVKVLEELGITDKVMSMLSICGLDHLLRSRSLASQQIMHWQTTQ